MTKIWYASAPDEPCRIGRAWWSGKVIEVRVSDSLSVDDQIREVIKKVVVTRWDRVVIDELLRDVKERHNSNWLIHISEWGLVNHSGKWEDLDPAMKPGHFRTITFRFEEQYPKIVDGKGHYRIHYNVQVLPVME